MDSRLTVADGALEVLLSTLSSGQPLRAAVAQATTWLGEQPDGAQASSALHQAALGALEEPSSVERVRGFRDFAPDDGALGVAAYCAMSFPGQSDPEAALSLAANSGPTAVEICRRIFNAQRTADAAGS